MDREVQKSDTMKEEVREITVGEVRRLLKDEPSAACLVDIREQDELVTGYIGGSVLIPDSVIKLKAEERLPDKGKPLILYCSEGIRSIPTARVLEEMGYKEVSSMSGGFIAWVEAGYDIESHGEMTADQVRRYSRQIVLHEVGEEGQILMLRAKVLLVGAGGLGCPAALYLGAAGVGTIGIVDFDKVDLSNLPRQVLHGAGDVGRLKVESAKDAILRINPEVSVITYPLRLSPESILPIIREYDIVVDGSDNFGTKFLLNDAAFFAGKPYIFGGAVRFNGQVSVFYPKGGGPCLRCMIPHIPPPGAPTCGEAGVLGVVPGQIGLMQAAEAVKHILGKGNPLLGRFLVYDCLGADFKVFTVRRNPACPLCGENPSIADLMSGLYPGACGQS
jgi:sulfur-carrier protein adenylyltransferase/sulfurtransferase